MTSSQPEHCSVVRIQANEYDFCEADGDAELCAEQLNALIYKWFPWAQEMLGPFATVAQKERCS